MTPYKLPRFATPSQRLEWQAMIDDIKRFNDAIAAREPYRLVPHGFTAAGTPRYMSPARAFRLRCPGFPPSMHLPAEVPECRHADGTSITKTRVQATFTIDAGLGIKHRQEHVWGSPEWQKSYGRRNRAEAGHGILKSRKAGEVTHGWTFLLGRIKTALMLAIVVAAQNLAMLLKWSHKHGDTRDPLTLIDVTDHGFVELDACGNLLGDVGPPIA